MDSKKYWNNRYASGGNSGYGSYGEQLAKKLAWLKGLPIQSISEIGCGDLNFATNLLNQYPQKDILYNGQDISDVVVDRNKKRFPDKLFSTSIDWLPSADLLMCIDVLFHILDDAECEELLEKINKKWTNYLAITAYERDEPMGGHVRIRDFDYKQFGDPLIREVVEEDGQLYFYLFKKPTLDLSKVSCCLITKDPVYPREIIKHVSSSPFGEILIMTNSDSPYRKHELFAKAKHDLIYYQDDDALCPISQLIALSDPEKINVAMKEGHFEAYKDKRMTMGLGWGSIFPKKMLASLKKYTDRYGEDEIFKRETERILTYLNYPQNRLLLEVVDLPSAWAEDRLWRQPNHNNSALQAEERCKYL